jgi:DNA-binding transcriptional ArsR family regulator
MARTSRPVRRLLFAGVATLCTLVAAFAAVGVANAGSSGEGGLPDSFRIAERHGGDKGEWLVTSTLPQASGGFATACTGLDCGGQSGSDVEVGPSSWNESFEWLPEEAWRDATGAWHAVHGYLTVDDQAAFVITVNGKETRVPDWRIAWHETSTGLVVGETAVGGGGAAASSSFTSGQRESISVSAITTWSDRPSCGLGDVLRSGVTDLAQPITVAGCTRDGSDAAFKAVGVEDLDGIEALRFDATTGDESLSYWFNPAFPEPVQVRKVHTGEAPHESMRRLVAFEAGSLPWDAGTQLPASKPFPPAVLERLQPWGPDDTGVEHPFPLSLAWQKAASDPTYPGFKQFLDEHPEAGAARTSYSERVDGSTVARTWEVMACGKDDAYEWFWSTQTSHHPTGPLGLPSVGPPIATYSTRGSSSPLTVTSVSGCPDPTELDDRMVTVASAGAVWQAFTGSPNPINSWQTRRHEDLRLTVGREAFDHPDNGNVTAEFLTFAQDGTLLSHTKEDTQHTKTANGLLQGGAGGGAGMPAGAAIAGPRPFAPRSLAFAALPIEGAAGASFAGLLAGLLVWFWPALKASPLMGLFSRLKEDQLLDHPVRAELAQRIEAAPGIHYQELLRALGKGKGGLEHHLRKLEAARIVRAVRGPYYTCYFPWAASATQRDAAPALKSEGARKVLAAVRDHPGITGQELSARTGLSASSVSVHVSRLGAAGLVHASRHGRSVRVQPTDVARQAHGAA